MLSVFRRARKSLGQFCVGLTAVVLSGCVATGPGTAPPGNGGSVQVALLIPSGSGQSQDELFGQNLENAARLAMADLSGVNIDLRVYKTGGSPAKASALAKQAVVVGNQRSKRIRAARHPCSPSRVPDRAPEPADRAGRAFRAATRIEFPAFHQRSGCVPASTSTRNDSSGQ